MFSTPNLTAIVSTLCDTNMASLVDALKQHNLDLILMQDGAVPTQEQLALIMQASPADLTASNEEMRLRAIRAENAMFPMERIEMLMRKYGATLKEPLGEIAERMSPEDREELDSLVRWAKADEAK